MIFTYALVLFYNSMDEAENLPTKFYSAGIPLGNLDENIFEAQDDDSQPDRSSFPETVKPENMNG
jgi:hypothetical protein